MRSRLSFSGPRLATALAVALVGACLADVAWAESCEANGIRVFPSPGAVIPNNGRFILEGVGKEQERVTQLIGKLVQLRGAGGVEVSLAVMRGWRSTVNRVAVILRPLRPLPSDTKLVLDLGPALKNAVLLNEGVRAMTWQTGQDGDLAAPKILKYPAIADGLYSVEKMGVTRFLRIHTTLEEDSPAYLVVTTRRVRGGGPTQRYFLPLDAGEARMGHDPCSGSFSFDDGRAYLASIEVFDIAGNQVGTPRPLEFQAPMRVTR